MTDVQVIWRVPEVGFDVVDFYTHGSDVTVEWSYADDDWEGNLKVLFKQVQAFEFRALSFANPPERESGQMGTLLELNYSAYERRILEGRTLPSGQVLRCFQMQLPEAGLIQVLASDVELPASSGL